MLRCDEIIGKREFESYSEFYLALCISAEMYRRGEKLDMSMMKVEKELLSDNELTYFKYLKSIGAIYINGAEEESVKVDDVVYYLDMNGITELKDVLVENREDCYYWSPDIVTEKYIGGPRAFTILSNIGNNLMHIIAHLIVGMYLGEREKKKIHVHFEGIPAKNTYYYVNLYSCAQTLEWFNDLVVIDVDWEGANVDIQYSIFCNNSQVARRYKRWSIDEKRDILKKYKMTEGSIVALWSRSGMCQSNIMGKITSVIIARIDEIGNDFVAVTTIPLNKTKEEAELDYYSIEEDKRHLFSDLLNHKPAISSRILSLYDLGIYNYFFDEAKFVCPLDTKEKVTKIITVDGKQASVEMKEVDALYWLLCQYSIEFDREMFRKMYNGGKDLMWDLYGDDSVDEY